MTNQEDDKSYIGDEIKPNVGYTWCIYRYIHNIFMDDLFTTVVGYLLRR